VHFTFPSPDGATSLTFPYGWAQLNSVNKACTYGIEEYQSSKTDGGDDDFNVWLSHGFPQIRLAQSNTLSLKNTFQAVILDTPVASGSVHSPYKQPVGARLARGGLRLAYNMVNEDVVRPVVDSVKLSSGFDGIEITISGLGASSHLVCDVVGSLGFEVLGNVSWSKTGMGWKSTPISSCTDNTVVINNIPKNAKAVRYLWYPTPCGMKVGQCPVSANVTHLGDSSGEKEIKMMLPPFIMGLS
jgi:hypothetical protein